MCIMHSVSTKTISLKKEAYDRLRAARRYPGESFSEIVLRATWPEDTMTASALLEMYKGASPRFSEAELDRIEVFMRTDQPPEDKWVGR